MSGNIIVQIYMYLVFSMWKLLEFKESGDHDHLPHLLPLPMLVTVFWTLSLPINSYNIIVHTY
jgi:hypothetical protein